MLTTLEFRAMLSCERTDISNQQAVLTLRNYFKQKIFNAILVMKCAIQPNIEIRELLRNAAGGGYVSENSKVYDSSYAVLVNFDSNHLCLPGIAECLPFQVGNLPHHDHVELKSIFIEQHLVPLVMESSRHHKWR